MMPYSTYSSEENEELESFCKENGIKVVGREYTFILGGKRYIIAPGKAKISSVPSGAMPIAHVKTPMVRIRGKKCDVIDIYTWLSEGKTSREVRALLDQKGAKRSETVIDKLLRKGR